MPQGPNTILLKGKHHSVYREGVGKAAITIKPGHLLDTFSTTADDYGRLTVQLHAVAGGKAEKLVAVEEFFTGGTINDAYPVGGLIRYHECQPGDQMYMLLKNGENVTPADYLSSAGDGTLVKIGTANATDTALFKPLEPLNNTSGSAAFIRVVSL